MTVRQVIAMLTALVDEHGDAIVCTMDRSDDDVPWKPEEVSEASYHPFYRCVIID